MTNQIRPGVDHTRVPSTAAMRARNVSRDPDAEALGLRQDEKTSVEPSERAQLGGPKDDRPQPLDRADS